MSEKKKNIDPNKHFSHYNDYELIFFARENDNQAWETLIWKYSFLIRARIKSLKIPKELCDDLYQEGCLTLIKCVKTFDENMNASFTSFFDLVLSRRFISLMRKEYNNSMELIPIEQLDILTEINNNEEQIINNYIVENCLLLKETPNVFSGLELQVYEQIIINGKTAKELSKDINVDVKMIYNAKQRVIKKIRQNIVT